jgi:hypothetical protein
MPIHGFLRLSCFIADSDTLTAWLLRFMLTDDSTGEQSAVKKLSGVLSKKSILFVQSILNARYKTDSRRKSSSASAYDNSVVYSKD